jgi:hypothetical protein
MMTSLALSGQCRSGLRSTDWVRLRSSWIASCAVHFTGAIAGFVLALWFTLQPAGDAMQFTELAATASGTVSEPPLVLIQEPNPPTAAGLAAAEIARLSADAVPPELQADLLHPNQPDPNSPSGKWVAARMLAEIARSEQLSDDEQLARLKSLTGQLNRIATEDSVTEVSGQLASLLGTEDRAKRPAAEPVAGEFDFDTAQVHDVRRIEQGPGQFTYVAILLDAQGRTVESPLTPTEGEQLYKVMELVKSNPLLERIYRGVAMSLLDKLMKPASDPASSGP